MLRTIHRRSIGALVAAQRAPAAAPALALTRRGCGGPAQSAKVGAGSVTVFAGSAVANAPGAASRPRNGKWCDEPTLEDLDVSVPQVNCAFVADLLARRRAEQAKQWGDLPESTRAAATAATTTPAAPGSKEPPSEFVTRPAAESPDGTPAPVPAVAPASETPPDIVTAAAAVIDDGVNLALHPSDGILLIDVRTVAEAQSWGTIEGAKILPMHEFWDALHLEPAQFEERYGFALPDKETPLLFFCHHGPRSLMAAQIAFHLGWRNVIHLRQGYYEWSKQFFLLCRRWMVHDHVTKIDHRRQIEFAAAREIAKDIAPEFNDIVEQEVDLIRIDHTRSVGEREVPLPARVLALASEFERQRDALELGGAAGGAAGALPEPTTLRIDDGTAPGEATSVAAVARSPGEQDAAKAAAVVAQRERHGNDPVLSSAPMTDDDFDREQLLLRTDYVTEAARVLRRRKSSERTGIPDSFMFRRKEQPYGAGR
jgi:rhodanese-related sulfurtransferase